MATSEVNYLNSGGDTLNVSVLAETCAVRSASTMWQYTVDSTKHYLLLTTYRVNDSTYRTNTYLVYNGTLTRINTNEESTGMTVTLTGSTLAITGINSSSYYNDITFIQLD